MKLFIPLLILGLIAFSAGVGFTKVDIASATGLIATATAQADFVIKKGSDTIGR